jgi:hypothetical protein
MREHIQRTVGNFESLNVRLCAVKLIENKILKPGY